MSTQFIFIGTHTIKEGKVEAAKQHLQEFCTFVEANEPRLIQFQFYLNEEGTELSVLQVHPDAASMAFHMQVAREHLVKAYEYLDTTRSLQIYGAPDDALLEQIKQVVGPDVPVIVKPIELAGFNRFLATAVRSGLGFRGAT